jgi:hypothetical protein
MLCFDLSIMQVVVSESTVQQLCLRYLKNLARNTRDVFF